MPSMTLPEPGASLASLESSDAARLFLARARAVAPSFEPGEADATPIAQICARLDGLPLAIELAAARADVLTCAQIAARLDDVFRFLTGGARTALERQQTMRAAVDWSHELLTPGERMVFRRIAAFAGGFSLEDCEEVCAGDDIARADVLDLLAGLVHKSLVVMEPRRGVARYRLLETIRQYAREKLLSSGEGADVRTAHLARWRSVAEEAAPALEDSRQLAWIARLDDDADNVRAALEWAVASAPCDGMMIAWGVRWFWVARGRWVEGRRWADALLEAGCDEEVAVWRARENVALHALLELDLAAAEPAYAALRDWAAGGRDPALEVRAISGLAEVAAQAGRFGDVRTFASEALGRARAIGDLRQVSHALSELAGVTADPDEARRLYEEAIEAARAAGDVHTVAIMLNELAVHEAMRGAFDRARAIADEALGPSREIGDPRLVVNMLRTQAWISHQQGDLAAARALYEEAAGFARLLGGRARTATALVFEGMVALLDGRTAEARARHVEALELLRGTDANRLVVVTLISLAEVCSIEGSHEAALQYAEDAAVVSELASNHRAFEVSLCRARAELALGRRAGARDALRAGLGSASAQGDPVYIAIGLELAASLAGDASGAAGLLGAADRIREGLRAPVPAGDRAAWDATRDAIQAACGPQGFEAAWAEGRGVGTGSALERARDLIAR